MAKKETFLEARDRLLKELPEKFPQTGFDDGYESVVYSRGNYLKYPYLNYGRGYRGEPKHKFTFKAQSVHDEGGLSLWIEDFRGMSAEDFHAHILRSYK